MDFGHSAMNFTENQQGSAILDKLRDQRKEGRFCDVLFRIQDQKFLAHRNVLAACSPYFDAVLKVDKTGPEIVTVECQQHEVFEVLLDYIYTGTIVVDSSTVEELMRLSNRFMINKLKGYCCEYLERNLSVTNCFNTKMIAKKCGLVPLVKTCESFIMANIMDVIQQDEILAFSDKSIGDFVSNKTLPLREELKLHILSRWIKHSLVLRQQKFQHLLTLLPWEKINISVVFTLLSEDPLYKNSEWCLYSILKVIQCKSSLPATYQEALESLHAKYAQNQMSQILHMAMSSALNTGKDATQDSSEVTVDLQNNTLAHITAAENESENKEVKISDSKNEESGFPSQTGQLWDADDVDDDDEDSDSDNALYVSLPEVTSLDREPPAEHRFSARPSSPRDDLFSELVQNNVQESPDDDDKKQKSKHKRKGIPMKIDPSPIKIRIQKTKIKTEVKIPKKRGRPPKLAYKNMKKEMKKPRIKIRQKVIRKESSGDGMNSGGEEIIDEINEDDFDDSDDAGSSSDDNYEIMLPDEDNTKSKGKRVKRKGHTLMSCPDCPFKTRSTEKLEKHKDKTHKDETVYTCGICNYRSNWNREYYIHMKTHFPGPPFLCDFSCGYAGERIQQLLYHRMTHTDERPFECTVCNLTFRSKNNLAMHARCHTGLKPFGCKVCGRKFATKGTLEQHSVTHSDLRPYLCDLCGFSTKYQSHLIAHKRIHTGDVFRCQYPNCKYSTPKRSQLACHMRTHMSIRSHVCSVCGRAFVEKSHLVRHEKIHLEDKPFKCDLCDYGSTRRDKLKDHVTKYHGDSSSPPKTPYKARKNRRQTFEAQAFPMLGTDQASAEMHNMIQQSETLRDVLGDEPQQQMPTNHLLLHNQNQAENAVHTHVIMPQGDQMNQALFTYSSPITTTISGLHGHHESILPSNVQSPALTGQSDTGLSSGTLTLSNSTVQSMLPSLLNPHLPLMVGSNQQPIMVVPHSSAQNQQVQYSNNQQTVTNLTALTQAQGLASQQADFTSLQPFMNIF